MRAHHSDQSGRRGGGRSDLGQDTKKCYDHPPPPPGLPLLPCSQPLYAARQRHPGTLQRFILSMTSGPARFEKYTCAAGYSGLLAKSASRRATLAGDGVIKYTAGSGSGSRLRSMSSTTDMPARNNSKQ